MKRLFILLLLLRVSAHATTTNYVDSQWTGTQSGTASQPWRALTTSAWTTINTELASADVVVVFSSRQAASDVSMIYSAVGSSSVADQIDLTKRTDTSTHMLTLLSHAFYNTSEVTPSWTAYSGSSRCQTDTISAQDPAHVNHNNIKVKGFKVRAPGSRKLISIAGSNWEVADNDCAATDSSGTGPGIYLVPTADSAHQGSSAYSQPCTNIFIHDNEPHHTSGEAHYMGGGGDNGSGGAPTVGTQGYPSHSNIIISNEFTHDAGTFGGQGDGLDIKGGLHDLSVISCTFSNLTDPNASGIRGIVMQGQIGGTNGNVLLDSCRFYRIKGEDAVVTVENTWGRPNHVTLRNLVINGSTHGSGVRFYPNDGNVALYNSTIVSNVDQAVSVDSGATVALTNNLLLNNNSSGAQVSFSGTVTHDYNFWAGSSFGATAAAHDTSTTLAANLNNAATLDFSLKTTAPAKDAGVTIAGFNNDIAGTGRPQGSAWDIGAYEFGLADPTITVQPQDATVTAPAAPTFSVTATGTPTLQYQWSKNGTTIAGATASNYAPATTAYPYDNGALFSCAVTSGAGGPVTTRSAVLTVNPPPARYVATNGSSGNNGLTISTPWDLTKAQSSAGPSATVYVLPGTNYPSILIQDSWQQWISLTPRAAEVVGSASLHAISGNTGVSNLLVQGFLVRTSAIDGIKFSGPNCTARFNVVQHAVSQGIAAHGFANTTIEYNLIENGGTDLQHDQGIYIHGTNDIVRGNVIRHWAHYACQLYDDVNDVADCQVYNNLFICPLGVVIYTYHGQTNYIYGNTIIADQNAVNLTGGVTGLSNNIIISGSAYNPIDTNATAATVALVDYNVTSRSFAPSGPHDVVQGDANAIFVNTNQALYWLKATSPARNAAKSTVCGPVDFFGVAQSSVADIGFKQYSAGYAADTRDLSVAGADFWASPVLPPIPQGLTIYATSTSAGILNSAGPFNYNQYPGLYVELFSNIGTTNSSTNVNVLYWSDQTTYHNDFFYTNVAFNNGPPVYQPSGLYKTPNGQVTLNFATQPANASFGLLSLNTLSNQPNTIYVVAKTLFTQNSTWLNNPYCFFDSYTGGRTLFQGQAQAFGSSVWTSGGSLLHPGSIDETNWIVWTFVFNGSSSLIRTNGVQFATGNPGTASMGRVLLGVDNTGGSTGPHGLYAVLMYNAAHDSGTSSSIESALRRQAGF